MRQALVYDLAKAEGVTFITELFGGELGEARHKFGQPSL